MSNIQVVADIFVKKEFIIEFMQHAQQAAIKTREEIGCKSY